MKNKHLVLLFLFTLLVGLAVRRAPWRNATFFQTKLLPIDTEEVMRLDISVPGQRELVLSRNDTGWLADQEGRSAKVPHNAAKMMLEALANLRSIRIVKSNQPDTLGFSKSTSIEIAIFYAHAATEQLTIGWETIENGQPATFIRLPRHEGIYLAENQLRAIFLKTLTGFRNDAIAAFNVADVQRFSILGQDLDSLALQKNDSIGNWQSTASDQTVADENVQQWFAKIDRLKKLPFADLFDESHASKTLFAEIKLEFSKENEPLSLKIYRISANSFPEEMHDRPFNKSQVAPFVLYFSQFPTNYFALSDTTLLRQICQPFSIKKPE